MARRLAPLAALVLPFVVLTALAAGPLRATGSCREGVAHGAYALSSSAGKPRAIGAFNRGRWTGSFIFWNEAGVRVAHLPFDDDALSGTAALWYASPMREGATPQKAEIGFAAGRRNGAARAWHPNGRMSTEAQYRDGRLERAQAWDAAGRPLPEADARARAAKDASVADAEIRALEDVVRRHPPTCAPGDAGGTRA